MKFTVSWLKDHLDTDITLEALLEALNNVGLEIEDIHNPADKLGVFKIAEVISAEPHPNADKLRVCQVSDGTETVQIVCGAPNARAGMKAVLGRKGDYIPGLDFTLKDATIRGVDSFGMMCSAKELELGEDHDGILDLAADAPVGESYAKWAGLDDPVIEVAITPNRQDCLGVYGIARDLAAAGHGTLRALSVPTVDFSAASSVGVSIATDGCSRFLGRAFSGIKNGPSPEWLQKRLAAIGMRPISALVDITNYISYDLGRPLHVYDTSKLNGDIIVRKADEGEKFTALDDKSYVTNGFETVIADGSGVLGFGGVIGGLESGCTDETTDVFLEAALFDPIKTAITGREHGILTDARYRFERGVDPLFIDTGMAIASQMILDLCGGTASEMVKAGEVPTWSKLVSFRPERVMTLGGLDLPAADSIALLDKLGFKVVSENGGVYAFEVPSWRVDVDGEADLVEDVLRIHGLDNVPSVPLPATDHKAGKTLSPRQKRARAVKRTLAASGMMEAVTWSFMTRSDAIAFGGGGDDLVIDNPISSELDCMRPSILPNLLKAAQRNANRGAEGMALFEVGPTYENDTPKGQELVASGVRTAKVSARHWAQAQASVSAFDAKADALAALSAAGAPVDNLMVMDGAGGHYHPGRSGTLRLGPKNVLATFGEIHPSALTALDVDGPAVGFEVFLDRIPAPKKSTATKGALQQSNLQAVHRDFAFIVDEDVAAAKLIKAVRGVAKNLITDVIIFDVYQGQGVEAGKKSVAISVKMEPKDQTFSDSEIEGIAVKIMAAVQKSTGAVLRA